MFSVFECSVILWKALTNSGDTGKALPPEQVTELNNDRDTMAVHNNDKQGQKRPEIRVLKSLRAADGVMSKDSKDYF